MRKAEISAICAEFDSPFYLIDGHQLNKNIARLQEFEKASNSTVAVSLKGFPSTDLLKSISRHFKSASVANCREYDVATSCGFDTSYFFSLSFQDGDFKQKENTYYIFNSTNQLKKFEAEVSDHKVGLRVNPLCSFGICPEGDPCSLDSRFGEKIIDIESSDFKGIDGVLIHNQSESGADALLANIEIIEEKFSGYLNEIAWINFGGGHNITDDAYDIEKASIALKKFQGKYNIQTSFELCTSFLWNTGFLVSSVEEIFLSSGYQTAILDLSLSNTLGLHMQYGNIPDIIDSDKSGKHVYNLGGLSCLSNDMISDVKFRKPLKKGDRVIFSNIAHYSKAMAYDFNGLKVPDIYIIDEDNNTLQLK